MSILAFVISLTFLLVSIFLYRKKNSISPIIIFFTLWTFILFLSMLNLYGIYKPSNEAYLLIILMLTFFWLGSFIYFIYNKKIGKNKEKSDLKQTTEKKEIKPMFKLFYLLGFCIILFNIIDIIIIIQQLLKGNPMWQIRNWTLEPFGSSNPILDRRSFIESLFRSVILSPAETIIPPVTAYFFFNLKDNKQRYKLLIMSLLVLITSSIAGGGGRLGFIYYIGCFLLSYFIVYKKKIVSKETIKKYKKILIVFLIIGIILVVIYTTIRSGIGSFIKQTYTYFALPPTLLSIWLPEIENVSHTYGMTTFFGIHSYFFRALDTIGLDSLVPQIYNESFSHILDAEIFKDVGYGIGNAFVTPIYYFLIDGGYPFVCIASLLFGLLVSYLYERFEKNVNARSFAIYALIMYGIFVTFMRIQTAIPAYLISFVLVFIILRAKKDSNVNPKELNRKIEKIKIQKKDEKLISIIIPVYNSEKYLNQCIESVINQTYKNLEIILIDDGSTDSSGKICDDFAKKDKRVIVLHKKNEGVSSARNTGLKIATGEWISFVDSDDWIDSEFCSILYNEAESDNKIDIVCSGYNRIYSKKIETINCNIDKIVYNPEEFLFKLLNVQNGYGFCHMKLIKKICMKNIKFQEDIQVGEDALFNIELTKNIQKVSVLGIPLYNYRFNNDSVVRKYDSNYANKYLKAMIKTKKYILKNYANNLLVNKNLNNYIVYHLLLVAVNFCFNSSNNKNFIEQIKTLKNICNEEDFKIAIKNSNYKELSITRKITLFTIKNRLFLITGMICRFRQYQFSR